MGVYPRACGGTTRSIPARAGEPSRLEWGERIGSECSGLSPRVRGNRRPADCYNASTRSIPARAGEPIEPTQRQPLDLSPRVRGNPDARRSPMIDGLSPLASYRVRSIPARAGEPVLSPKKLIHWQRSIPARAGEPFARLVSQPLLGLSPRVRGNPSDRLGLYPRACGGTRIRLVTLQVYPRACGGTGILSRACRATGDGLSPRVRGNPPDLTNTERRVSIPARAGEPA